MTPRNLFAALIVLTAITTTAFAQPPRDHEGGGHDGPPPSHPILGAIDQNQDHEISAEEIENASKNLLSLDKNGDGILNAEDLGHMGPPHSDRPQGQRGQRGQRSERRPGGRDGAAQGEEGGRRGGDRQRRGGEEGGSRTERFVERAMSFDANGDGMLSQEELTTMAAEMPQRGGRGGEGGQRGGGQRGGGGGRPGGRPE